MDIYTASRPVRRKMGAKDKRRAITAAIEKDVKGYVSNNDLVARDAQRAQEHRAKVRRELGLE